MNQISQDLINEIRNSVDIVDVIGSYLELTPKGRNYFGVCPFHDDNNPSMSVSKEKQIYTCFSCHATGNVFKFLMDYENISFIEAVKKCADMANISLDVKVNNFSNVNDKYRHLYDIYDTSTKFYHNLINTSEGKEAKEYLIKRNINEDLIKEFKIGLSPKDRTLLTKFLSKNKYNKEELLQSGLIIENNYGLTDIYCNRIMFPLEDLNGRVVGFSGRIYNVSDTSKYINTKETEIFKKREVIYNYHRAKDEARNKGYVIVMEGFMDVIRAHSVGIKNTVATMGTAVTSTHANLLKRMAKEVYLCFDGDGAGLKATLACITELGKLGVIPKIIRLEDNLDPDEYIIKFGKDKFLDKVDKALTVMEFKMNYLKQTNDITKDESKATYVNEVIKELSGIEDAVLREITLNKLSYESNLDINFLKEELKKVDEKKEEVKRISKEELKPIAKNNKLKGYEKAEMYLVYHMLNSKEVIRMFDRRVDHMLTDEYRILAREISDYYHKYNDMVLADFMTYLNDYPKILSTLNKILSLDIKDDYAIEDIDGYIKTIRKSVIDNQIEKLNKRIKETDDLDKQVELLKKQVELRNQEI